MLDHLVYATPNLVSTVHDITARFGVRPTPGGSHVGLGSRNELLALGGGVYLELIGPDPDQPDPDRPRPFGIDDLDEPRLASFAVGEGPAAFDATMRRLRDAGFETEERQMTRTREDGMVLSWRLARIVDDVSGGVAPFLIDWGETPHPTESLPDGVELVSLQGVHPSPRSLDPVLGAIDADLVVEEGPEPGLEAVFRCPSGTVTLR